MDLIGTHYITIYTHVVVYCQLINFTNVEFRIISRIEINNDIKGLKGGIDTYGLCKTCAVISALFISCNLE